MHGKSRCKRTGTRPRAFVFSSLRGETVSCRGGCQIKLCPFLNDSLGAKEPIVQIDCQAQRHHVFGSWGTDLSPSDHLERVLGCLDRGRASCVGLGRCVLRAWCGIRSSFLTCRSRQIVIMNRKRNRENAFPIGPYAPSMVVQRGSQKQEYRQALGPGATIHCQPLRVCASLSRLGIR